MNKRNTLSGRWQREISGKLRESPEGFWLYDLLPADFTKWERGALEFSVLSLAKSGYVRKEKRLDPNRRKWVTWIMPGRKPLDLPPSEILRVRIPWPQNFRSVSQASERD
jgi:hypothetical protein